MKAVKSIGILGLLILGFSVNAQPWAVNPHDFQFSMNVTGQVFIESGVTDQQTAYLGAFVNGECRGLAQASEESGNYKTYFLSIYSNAESDTVNFKWMDVESTEYTMVNTIKFVSDAIIGSLDIPFLWMETEQYASTDFLTFELDSQVTATTINAENKTLAIMVSKETDRSVLTPKFTLAPGATAYIDQTKQISGLNENNYINTVHYLVKGVDGVETDWSVEVMFDNSGISDITKKSFNPYPNPASNFVTIQSSNMQKQAVKIMDITGRICKSGEFTRETINISDLNKGAYFIKVGNTIKKLIVK